MTKTIIIGAGFAGIGAARFFTVNSIDATVFEQQKDPEKNLTPNGNVFRFDFGSQIVSTSNKNFANLFNDSCTNKAEKEPLNIRHFLKGYSIIHPAIENLHKLPKPLVIKIVSELSELKTQNDKSTLNLREWLYAKVGKTYTDSFLEKIIRKTYTLPSEKIDFTDTINEFEQSSFEDILAGALAHKKIKSNGKTENTYPLRGDFKTILKKAKTEIQIKFGYAVKSIDPKEKVVVFENGEKENYNYLVSSMPLPDLIGCINDIPDNIKRATEKLAWTSCVVVDIETNRNLSSNVHYAFFYDNDILFSQLIFPQTFPEKSSPKNYGTVQAIVHFSKKYKPLHLHPDSFIEPVINNLKRYKILGENNKVVSKAARLLPYANIIHDFNRRANLSVIHKYLDEINILYCGRYGLWTNLKADESYTSGETAAKKVRAILNYDLLVDSGIN